jgi:hypothetical protein
MARAHPTKNIIGMMAAKFRILKSGISMIGSGCRLGAREGHTQPGQQTTT